MKQASEVHVFRSGSVEVAVQRKGGDVALVIRPPRAGEGQQHLLTFVTWVCQGSAEARELSRLLRHGAEMAAWLESGGSVEQWNDEALRRPSFEHN